MSVASNVLTSFICRLEKLIEEKQEVAGRIAIVRGEAKSAGLDSKVLSQMLKERRMTPDALEEWQEACNAYRTALGHLADTPLGAAAHPATKTAAPVKPKRARPAAAAMN